MGDERWGGGGRRGGGGGEEGRREGWGIRMHHGDFPHRQMFHFVTA